VHFSDLNQIKNQMASAIQVPDLPLEQF
jgi:hypothetical protein